MDTTRVRAGNAAAEKKAAFSRGLLELSGHRRCPVDLFQWFYLGGSAALGAAGFGAGVPVPSFGAVVPVPGFGAEGFAAPVVGGAGTPDCTL